MWCVASTTPKAEKGRSATSKPSRPPFRRRLAWAILVASPWRSTPVVQAVLWMWVIGIVGMAIKHVEVTQSLLFRDVSDPDNPAGGPMFVAKKGYVYGLRHDRHGPGRHLCGDPADQCATGGNMFQAGMWPRAPTTPSRSPRPVSGIILAVLAAFVLVGGIKRIGSVAGKLVPFMCGIYLLAGLSVVVMYLGDIPAMFALIWKHGAPEFLGGEPAAATGAFIGGSLGYAMQRGIERALFSSEAGQGSAPIAHSAVQTKEPVREGVVAGLRTVYRHPRCVHHHRLGHPVHRARGTETRKPRRQQTPSLSQRIEAEERLGGHARTLPERTEAAREILNLEDGQSWRDGDEIFFLVRAEASEKTGTDLARVSGTVRVGDDGPRSASIPSHRPRANAGRKSKWDCTGVTRGQP